MRSAADSDTAAVTGSSTPAQAAALAAELASLMDMIETEDKNLEGLAELVLEKFSAHWQLTIDFLKIVTEYWPAYLGERGLLSAAGRRNAVLHAEARRLAAAPPKVRSSLRALRGSIPATVALMRTVMGLPQGAIVLPALDLALDDESWDAIKPGTAEASAHPENPQFGMKAVLDGLGISRAQVSVLKGAEQTTDQAARSIFVSEAMRPAGTTARWQAFAAAARAGKVKPPQGLNLVEAPTAQDEAEVVALILREAANTPGRTAALVSPDRLLARRVAVRLEAWGIKVDDSAGRPFVKTPPGAFLDLVINAVAKGFAPRELMALLEASADAPRARPIRGAASSARLEIAAFRTAYLGEGLDGVDAALERASRETASRKRRDRAVNRLWPADWDGARDLVARSELAVAPLTSAYARGPQPLADSRAGACGAPPRPSRGFPPRVKSSPASPLWQGEAGRRRHALLRRSHGREPARARNPARRLRRSLSQPRFDAERAAARAGASAPVHLGSVRSPPAADGCRDPGLAQRRHVAPVS